YRPEAKETLPVLIYFHGGGFVICSLDTHDGECRRLANASGCAVISVDYRLAPENKYPAAAEDAYAATEYIAEHAAEFGIDPQRIAVAGDSAGGNLATVVATLARDRGGPLLKFQLLIYPLVDFADNSPSMQEYAKDYFLTRESMDWFTDCYLPNRAAARQPSASPKNAEDVRGLPPAMILTAEFDPLRDQGEAYARKLKSAGVPVELKRYDGMIHAFFSFPARSIRPRSPRRMPRQRCAAHWALRSPPCDRLPTNRRILNEKLANTGDRGECGASDRSRC